MDRLRYAKWAGRELYDILPQSLFLSIDNTDALISNVHKRSYSYAEDYLYNKNSISILLMLRKYLEFWVNIFHLANDILHA